MIKTKVYLHGYKESMRDLGSKIGLKGEALNEFQYGFNEVEFDIEVDELTGEYEIIAVDGRPLAKAEGEVVSQ